LNERFEQYINGKREKFHSNFPVRLKKILWEARSTPTLGLDSFFAPSCCPRLEAVFRGR
jgi:hypothetical protein